MRTTKQRGTERDGKSERGQQRARPHPSFTKSSGTLEGGSLHGCTAARLHGSRAAQLQSCTAARLHGYMAARLHGCTGCLPACLPAHPPACLPASPPPCLCTSALRRATGSNQLETHCKMSYLRGRHGNVHGGKEEPRSGNKRWGSGCRTEAAQLTEASWEGDYETATWT